jgi:hypothetical protein
MRSAAGGVPKVALVIRGARVETVVLSLDEAKRIAGQLGDVVSWWVQKLQERCPPGPDAPTHPDDEATVSRALGVATRAVDYLHTSNLCGGKP